MNTVLKAGSCSAWRLKIINQKIIQMLEVKDGKIYVEGVETTDPELIGFAFIDFAENLTKNNVDAELKLKDNHFDNDYVEIIFIPKN